jgi:hypothetical protein
MRRCLLILLLAPLATASWPAEGGQSPSVQQRLERLAASATHFATDDIVTNRRGDSRWPEGLHEEQQSLLAELRSVGDARKELQDLLRSPDPRVRTLALGALFIREDPQDLPLIAGLLGDRAATFPRLRMAMTSMGGRLPLSSFESDQTVGDVAQVMIGFYLASAFRVSAFGRELAIGTDLKDVSVPLFEKYWAERSSRTRCASWYLVKMRRATRDSSPIQPQYEPDVRRVLAEIDALPPDERAWTLLYVRQDQSQLNTLVSDAAMVAALSVVGPDVLMKVLRRERVSDDPDLAAPTLPSWIQPHTKAVEFILAHAPKLLRPSDADAVVASAEAYRRMDNNTRFVAAAARLRGIENPDRAAESLKAEIKRIPGNRTLGPRDQATLAFALWQMRGVTERSFLADWFYTALPFVTSPDALEYFLRDVEKENRPDTSLLLGALVGHARFEQMGWAPLSRVLEMVNKTLPLPLVDQNTIYRYLPASERPDQQDALAGWRRLLRKHFGLEVTRGSTWSRAPETLAPANRPHSS